MDNVIRPAERKDIPALTEMWKACFPDSEEYIKYFYRENFNFVTTIVECVDGKPVSFSHTFDAVIKDRDACHKALYAYAGGTLPEYRNNGYFVKILKYIQETAVKTDSVLFFKPALHLIPYYSSFGCVKGSVLKLVTVNPEEIRPFVFTDLSYKEYNRMRDSAFSEGPYVKWPDEYIRWCIKDNEFFSGKTFKTELDGKEYFLMVYPKGDKLIVNETDMSVEQLRLMSGYLCKSFGSKLIEAYMPARCEEGEEELASFIYNSDLRNYYTNLILT